MLSSAAVCANNADADPLPLCEDNVESGADNGGDIHTAPGFKMLLDDNLPASLLLNPDDTGVRVACIKLWASCITRHV